MLMGLFMAFLVVWLGVLIYLGPLMLLQVDKRLRLIARNAFLMVLSRPFFTLFTGLLMLLLGVVVGIVTGGLLPLLITFAFLAIWSFRATSRLIADDEARRANQQEQALSQANTDKGRGGQVRPRD
jgi:L-lactate permease